MLYSFLVCLAPVCLTVQSTAQIARLSPADLKPDTTDFTWTYMLNFEGDSVGYSTVEVSFEEDQFKLYEITEVPGFFESVIVRGDIATMEPYAVVVSGETGGHGIDCQMQLGNRITGYARYPDHPDYPLREMDTVRVPHMMERTSSFFLYLPWMPFDSLSKIAFTQLNTTSCRMYDVTVTATGEKARVHTPAGSFRTTKITYRGGETSQNFYLSMREPRVITRITIEGHPWEYILTTLTREE